MLLPSTQTPALLPRFVFAGALLALLVSPPGLASTRHWYGTWSVLTFTGPLGHTDNDESPWRFWFDGQHRAFDVGSGSSQVVARPALGYALDSGWSLWAGYGYFNTRLPSGRRDVEHRYWQQVQSPAFRRGRTTLRFRGRLEQRDVENTQDLGWVLRTQLKATRAFREGGRWAGVVMLEPFFTLNDTDWSGGAGTQQLRVFLGLGHPLGRASFEFGYMNQLIRRGRRDTANHLAVLSLTTRL